MVTKTAVKPKKGPPGSDPSQQELRIAYQAHTLAQLLYARMVALHPWMPTVLEMNQTAEPWTRSGPGASWNPMVEKNPTEIPWTGPGFFVGPNFPRC